MTELATEIRKAVIERVDRAPMAPTIESIDTLDRASLPAAHRHPRRGVLVGAGLFAVLALAAGVLVTARLSRDTSQVSVGTTLAPPGKPATPLAGRSLPARYGLPNGVPGYHLVMEVDRAVGLAADDVTWLPTGPLGPVYAQSLRGPYDPTATKNLMDGIAVLTVLPEEQASVIAAITGKGASRPTTVGGRAATVAEPWSSTDDEAVTWVQDGVAIIVTASPSVTEPQLLSAAADVTPIATVPSLTPMTVGPSGGYGTDGYLTLDPHAGPDDQGRTPAPAWETLLSSGPLSPAMGTFLANRTDGGVRYTFREIGDPMSHSLAVEAVFFNGDTGETEWSPNTMSIMLNGPEDAHPDRLRVTGTAPRTATTVELGLDDGTTIEGPTYDTGLGWPVRAYSIVVPSNRVVVHLTARSDDGTVRYSGAMDHEDGSSDAPGSLLGGRVDVAVCGGDPSPNFPNLDC